MLATELRAGDHVTYRNRDGKELKAVVIESAGGENVRIRFPSGFVTTAEPERLTFLHGAPKIDPQAVMADLQALCQKHGVQISAVGFSDSYTLAVSDPMGHAVWYASRIDADGASSDGHLGVKYESRERSRR